MTDIPSRKHLVLLGTGRANMSVLKKLVAQGIGGLAVTLVAPQLNYLDEAMLAGHLLGEKALEDFVIPLKHLLDGSGIGYVPDLVQALDPQAQCLHLASGEILPYDALSLNAEPELDRARLDKLMPGVRANAMFAYPRYVFLELWPQLLALAQKRPLQIAVIGHNKFSVELALAAAEMLAAPHGSRVTLLTNGAPVMQDAPPALRKCALARLKALNITVLHEVCVSFSAKSLQLESGAALVCDAPLLALESDTPAWLQDSGVKLLEDGQVALNRRLQSESHSQIFVVPYDAPTEAGPALEANLHATLFGGSLKNVPFAPKIRTMQSGARRAIVTLGPWALEGNWAWRWKNARDRQQLAAVVQRPVLFSAPQS
ncbi:NAD(P)/FAD-dependent oxidoreductase [Ottowia cancrivicina]|uniref:FAD-dependent oxidoreductase n=1 Tax=Ottowia cancrivicina TaxID=3040346 RepID=A0AAW6RJC9_9BURK|nr:FAD-dependent oxidoreductase [Ottowia sp. 10c7w1]MDG9698361.1 FAD-dependent oxidoreductase [Ottowia sp. 10c7w1]